MLGTNAMQWWARLPGATQDPHWRHRWNKFGSKESGRLRATADKYSTNYSWLVEINRPDILANPSNLWNIQASGANTFAINMFIIKWFHHANDSSGINRPSLDDCHEGDQKARLTLPRHLLLTDAKSPAALFVTSSTFLSPTALSDDRYLFFCAVPCNQQRLHCPSEGKRQVPVNQLHFFGRRWQWL